MLDRQLDFDAVALAADLQFDAPRARDAAAGGHGAGDAAATAVEQVDIVRPEIERSLAVRQTGRGEAERAVLQPELAAFDPDRQRARFADEAVDEGRVRRVVDLVGGADLLDAALAHHHDPVGEFQRLFLVVGDEDGGVAGRVVDLAQPAAQLAPHLRVERAEGLVEQQHPRLDGKRAGERHALPLAARKLVRIALFQPGKLDEVEQFRGAPADFACGGPRRARPHLQAKADIVGDRHVAEQRVVLEDEADIALLHALLRRVVVAEEDGALGRPLQPGDQPQQRRLAGAGRPEQRDQLARADVERHIAQRRKPVEFLAHISDGNVHRAPNVRC